MSKSLHNHFYYPSLISVLNSLDHGNIYWYMQRLTFFIIDFWCFNATFSNISAISWRPVLVVEEAGVPGENHRPWANN
jgi:hypothetical protein